jgi:hypothetical protein
MNKKILIFTASLLGALVAFAGAGSFLLYKAFIKKVPGGNPKAFPAFAKKEMATKFEKTVEFSKANVAKAKAMLEKTLDNIGEINFPELIIHDI